MLIFIYRNFYIIDMLIDIEKLASKYIGCLDCWCGYDNYDQTEYVDFPINGINIIRADNFDCRADGCEIKELKSGEIPRGVISCIVLLGKYSKNTKINIECSGKVMYNICGQRTMVYVPNVVGMINEFALTVANFNGRILAHYVNWPANIESSIYKVMIKNCDLFALKYCIYTCNIFNCTTEKLQTMWNYIYPGQRPKNKFLFHAAPLGEGSFKFNINESHRKIIIEYGSYNAVINSNAQGWIRYVNLGLIE